MSMRLRHTRFSFIGLAASLGASLQAHAATQCQLGDTIEQCWERFMPPQRRTTISTGENAVAATAAAADVESALKSKETGLDGGAPELATTTRNLLPLLAVSGLVSDSDGNASDQLFTVDLNFLIGGLAKDNNTQLKAVLNTDPQVFEPLKAAFDTASGSAERTGVLQDDLSAADDYTISLTYSHINKRVGRSFKQYQYRFSNLFEAALTVGNGQGIAEARTAKAMLDVIQQLAAERPAESIDESFVIRDPLLLEGVNDWASGEANQLQRVRETITRNVLPRFADLVNNQPQLTFSADLHERDALVGAKERAIKVAYEFGLANVNDFEAKSGRVCDLLDDNVRNLSLTTAAVCLESFRGYIEQNEQRLKNADRFSVALSYVDVDDYNYASAADGVSLARDGASRLDVAVGYGRTLQIAGSDHDSRLDFVAKYEDYSDDPDNRDRMVATLTLTTRLNGISIPLVLLYANHDKYLPDADETLGAHIGIKYQLDSKL